MKRADWPTVAGLLVLIGLLLRAPVVWQLGLLVTLVGGVSWAWARVALSAVTYERTFSASQAFVGDSLDMTVRVANDKLLPVTWFHAADQVPDALPVTGVVLGAATRSRYHSLRHAATLLPYDHLTWHYTLSCPTRGIYVFGPATVSSGDPFGLYRDERNEAADARLVVYPALVPLTELGLPPAAPLGERRDQRSLDHDPVRPVGVRPYQPGDSQRLIDWRATARLGELQVRELEAVSRQTTVVVLNVATFDTAWIGVNPDVQERLIQVAGSLAVTALDHGRRVGLVTNGCPLGSGRVARVPPSDNPAVRGRLLEVLAGVSAFVSVPVERLLLSECRQAPWGATLVVVTAVVSEALAVALVRARRAGRRLVLVSLDSAYHGSIAGVTTYHLAGPQAEARLTRQWQAGWMRETIASEGRGG